MNKHYHFIGIGGIGMGALALLLIEKGFKVTGSDLCENKVTRQLKSLGAKIGIGHDPKYIEESDYVIFSSAIDDSNCELIEAKKKNIPIIQRAELLASLMKDYIAITVAGAHGKTTTTSMVSNLLVKAGLCPTTAIGGMIKGTTSNAQLGKGKYFVAEVDESDGSFLNFHPQYSIITNVDLEHVDYYENIENLEQAFRKFLGNTIDNGIVIASGDDQRLMAMIKGLKVTHTTFGLLPHNDVHAKEISYERFSSCFNCCVQGIDLGQIFLKIPGEHNVLNALACISLAMTLAIPFDKIKSSLEDYQGVLRRFQLKSNAHNILVVDDYAHHPTEITTTLQTAKMFNCRQLITVFQPHRYTRVQRFFNEFIESLAASDYIIITDIYAASEDPLEDVSAQKLVECAQKKITKPVIFLEKERVAQHILEIVQANDMVLTLGAGDITQISDEVVSALENIEQNEFEPAS